jgi:hypothetical protein
LPHGHFPIIKSVPGGKTLRAVHAFSSRTPASVRKLGAIMGSQSGQGKRTV